MQKEKEKILYEAVVLFFIRDGKVLLAIKKKKIGKGLWNGYGGGIEPEDLTPKDAAVRELGEESGGMTTSVDKLTQVADTCFHNTTEDGTTFVCHMLVYFAYEWKGEARETDEMSLPTWFDFDKIPTDKMLPADKVWLPIVLSGKKIIFKANYGPHQSYMIGETEIQYVDSF
jgi:8-oxo-dGTP diphosphatase/2-hydroxy-dATP diphosphatase